MFVERADIDAGECVWLFAGSSNSDADFQAYLDSIDHLLGIAPAGIRPAGIQVIDRGNPIPGPAWRRRIADATSSLPRNDALYCMVTDSAVTRGALTAINWLRRPPYDFAVRSSFPEAVVWVDELRGFPSRSFARLLEEARAEARSRGA